MAIQMIPIGNIRTNDAALREVQEGSEEFQGIVGSIRQRGFVGAISGRPARDPQTGELIEGEVVLLDGLQRFSAAKLVGLTEIPVDVLNIDESDALEAQIMMNVHRVETKPREYATALLRIMGLNPTWTKSQLADKLQKSAGWLDKMLKLNRIDNETINNLINEGKIPLTNAYALSKLPPDVMADYIEDAMTLQNGEFAPMVIKRKKEIDEERRKGRAAGPAQFSPSEYMRKLKDIRAEIDSLESLTEVFGTANPANPQEAARLALQWVLHVDPVSVATQKEEWETKQAKKAEDKRRRDEERARKKAAEAAKKAEEAAAEVTQFDGEIDD